MIAGGKLFHKLLEDWGIILLGFALLVGAYYGFRYVDAGATVDGIAGVYIAIKVLIIGYAAASLSGAICARLFGMLGRAETKDLALSGWVGLSVATGYWVRWLVVFYLLFSRAIGQ